MSDVFIDRASTPVVAILTAHDEENGFRGNRNNFIDLIQTGKEMGVQFYVVTPPDLKFHMKRIAGHTYNHDISMWVQQWMPLPHVIYNRIPYRKDEQLPEVKQKIEECLRHPHIRLFNPAFFNKWSLFEWLRKTRATRAYIPLTSKLTNYPELRELLIKYPKLYLKPELGKAGSGIMRVERRKMRPRYRLSIQASRGSTIKKYKHVSSMWKNIVKQVSDEPYIVQQAIQLVRYDHRPYDLRVLAQKNTKGTWKVSGVGARVAGSTSITTHVPRGGSIEDPIELLAKTFGVVVGKQLLQRVKKIAIIVAKQIERGSGFPHGEMSLDLGIDTNGKIWFFEANAKPMKFDEPLIRKKSLERLVAYCIYLSKKRR